MSKKAKVVSQKVLNTRVVGMFYRIESSSFDMSKNTKNLTMYYEK